MSKLAASDFSQARHELLTAGASAEKILAALEAVNRLEVRWLASERNAAWASGYRGDGFIKAEGFTETLTDILRRLAATGEVSHADIGSELPRHISAIRARLKARGSSIQIETLVGVGYQLTAGFDELLCLLRGHKSNAIRAPGFTEKETTILSLLESRGALHVDQVATLQRYISKIRAKLPKQIVIVTAGDGLYTVDAKARELIAQLLSGEIAPAADRKAKRVGAQTPKALQHSKPDGRAASITKPKRTRKLEEGAALAA